MGAKRKSRVSGWWTILPLVLVQHYTRYNSNDKTRITFERQRGISHFAAVKLWPCVTLCAVFRTEALVVRFTCWMMVQLIVSPKTAYRHTAYHKQTKNQWARDDPAFLVVCMYLLVVTSTAYCIAFSDDVWKSILTILTVICIDFLGIGLLWSTLCWFIANRFLKRKAVHHHTSEQSVEWLYAFDVHCNSFIPIFWLLYVGQYFLTPILLWKSIFSSIISCLLFVASISYYHYMNFLGYSALPFLEHTEAFLWPVPLCVLVLPFLLLVGFNPSRLVLGLLFR